MKRIGLSFICLAIVNLYGCSTKVSEYTPEKLINNALKETDIQEPFYAELEFTIQDQDEVTEHFFVKYWYDYDGKYREEMEGKDDDEQIITVDNGESITIYSIEENEAYIISDPELFAMNKPTFKEEANHLLEEIIETHIVEVVGEEKIAGRQTHHLVATAKEPDILLGDQELWIDKKNWMVLKKIIHSGDMKMEVVCKKIDYRKKMSPDLFVLDLPASVEKHFDSDNLGRTVTLQEAISEMTETFLYFPETNDLKIINMNLSEFDDEQTLTLEYEQNNLPLFELTISRQDVELSEELAEILESETIRVRGQKAYYTDGDIRHVDWNEGELNYSVMILNPRLTKEDFEKITKDMKAGL